MCLCRFFTVLCFGPFCAGVVPLGSSRDHPLYVVLHFAFIFFQYVLLRGEGRGGTKEGTRWVPRGGAVPGVPFNWPTNSYSETFCSLPHYYTLLLALLPRSLHYLFTFLLFSRLEYKSTTAAAGAWLRLLKVIR